MSIIAVHTSNTSRARSNVAPAMSPKLCPAENTGPFAARITPVASLLPTSVNAAVTSRITSSDSALRFSGRFSVIVTTSPPRSTRRCSLMVP